MTTAVDRLPSEASVHSCPIATPAGGHPPGTSQEEVYGLLRLAGIDVALPLEVLREVVHCPAKLAPLPSDVPEILGAMNLHNIVLPVIDLGAVLARGGERSADQVVVVVACGGQVIGVLADEVRGVTRLRGEALLPVAAASRRLLFSHTFQHPDDGTVFSVLDAGAMLRETGCLPSPTPAAGTPSWPRGRPPPAKAAAERRPRRMCAS